MTSDAFLCRRGIASGDPEQQASGHLLRHMGCSRRSCNWMQLRRVMLRNRAAKPASVHALASGEDGNRSGARRRRGMPAATVEPATVADRLASRAPQIRWVMTIEARQPRRSPPCSLRCSPIHSPLYPPLESPPGSPRDGLVRRGPWPVRRPASTNPTRRIGKIHDAVAHGCDKLRPTRPAPHRHPMAVEVSGATCQPSGRPKRPLVRRRRTRARAN